jgi:hypothetical protein
MKLRTLFLLLPIVAVMVSCDTNKITGTQTVVVPLRMINNSSGPVYMWLGESTQPSGALIPSEDEVYTSARMTVNTYEDGTTRLQQELNIHIAGAGGEVIKTQKSKIDRDFYQTPPVCILTWNGTSLFYE